MKLAGKVGNYKLLGKCYERRKLRLDRLTLFLHSRLMLVISAAVLLELLLTAVAVAAHVLIKSVIVLGKVYIGTSGINNANLLCNLCKALCGTVGSVLLRTCVLLFLLQNTATSKWCALAL